MKTFLLMFLLTLLPVIVSGQEIYEESSSLFSTGELQDKVVAKPGGKCLIRSVATLRGFIKIVTHPGDEASVKYFIRAKTGSRSRALDYIDLISVSLVRMSDGIRLELRGPNPAPWEEGEEGEIEIELVLPESTSVDIDATYFDVEAEGPFADFQVASSLGRVALHDATGLIVIATANRRVTIEKISGEIDVSTTNASIEATDIKSSESAARFTNDGGRVKINNVQGSLDIQNAFGRIDIYSFTADQNRSYIRGASEPITVELLSIDKGKLIVSNRYEDVEIRVPDVISSAFSLSVEEGAKIEVRGLKFHPDLITPNRLSMTAGDGEALVRATVRGRGSVFIRGTDEQN